MSVSSDGKKISGPIFWGDPYTVLRVSPSTSAGYDAGTIICHVNINKWSKRKPMRYDQFEPLTELQFAGTVQDRVQGIFYGLKMSCLGGQLGTMHEATFEYMRVRPGIDKVRKTDWNGYDQGAKPNPIGTVPEDMYIDLDYPHVEINIAYDEYNTTGVSMDDVLQTYGKHLKDYYPCALITIKGKKFVHALWNLKYDLIQMDSYNTKNKGYTPIYDSGWYQRWALPMPSAIPTIDGGSVAVTDGTDILLTVFFLEEIAAVSGGTTLTTDFREWVGVDDTINLNNGYACPEAVAKTVHLKRRWTRGIDILDGTWRQSSGSSKLTVMLTTAWADPEEGATYTLTGTVYDSNNNSIGSVSFDFIKSDFLQICQMTCNSSLLEIPTTSVLKLRWEIKCSLRPNKVCNSGVTELTYSEPTIGPWVSSN